MQPARDASVTDTIIENQRAITEPTAGSATIYSMADDRYFLGVAALLGSLRLTGNDYAVVILDGGMTDEQRALVSSYATLAAIPDGIDARTPVAKWYLGAANPNGVVVWIDSDCLVLDSLTAIVEKATGGSICAVRDDRPAGIEHRHPDWQEVFGLASAPRAGQTYVNAGFLAFSTERWPTLLPRMLELTPHVPPGRVLEGTWDDNPFWGADQDLLNAVLMSEFPSEALEVLPAGTMAYTYKKDARPDRQGGRGNGAKTPHAVIAHFSNSPKPWQPDGWSRFGAEPYADLYVAALAAVDVTTPALGVPTWLKRGVLGWSTRVAIRWRHYAGTRARTAIHAAMTLLAR